MTKTKRRTSKNNKDVEQDENPRLDLEEKERFLLQKEIELLRRENEILQQKPATSNFTFKDLEESLPNFTGNDSYALDKWICDFEEAAAVAHWNEVEKLVYGKKLLKGSAKLFLRTQTGITNWSKLKAALENEFSSKISSAEVHKMLRTRKKKHDESYMEYIFKMQEICLHSDVDEESLIDYIVAGILDEETNKVILYGAKGVNELKSKFREYEKFKSNLKIKHDKNIKQDKRNDTRHDRRQDIQQQERRERCFNCGLLGHKSKECRNRDKGTRCFKCNEYGHIAANCNHHANYIKKEATWNKNELKKDVYLATDKKKQNMELETKIGNTVVTALVDTGSDVNLITATKFLELENITLEKESMILTGIGDSEVKTLGKFNCNIDVDEGNFFTTFHVVSDTVLPVNCIIGNDLLQHAKMTLNEGMLKISYAKKENHLFVLPINALSANNIHPREIQQIIDSYKPKEGKTTEIRMKITLTDETPIYQHPRRLSLKEQEEVDSQLQEWLQKGIIRPSVSEFASPIVLVKKKDGRIRICVDYRRINQTIIKDRYPLPLIEDQIDKLQGATYFSTLDLENGFFHVEVDEHSRKYTSFVTPSGQFEFCRVPFGLCNSPSVFQRYINNIFRDLINAGKVLTYMDDLIIPSTTREEGTRKLKEVLAHCEESGLRIKWEKCTFLEKKIEYLGYEIEKNQIRPSENKTLAVKKFPKPTTVKQIQRFLGLTGYFRKFVPGYAVIAKPLSDLLKKNENFIFMDKHKIAFETLKDILSKKPVLQIYSPYAETELHTDASKYGIGAILLQKNHEDGKMHPIYYMSYKTSLAQQNWSSYELEVYAIIQALKKFRVYLLGLKFKIITDCSAFELTMKKKELATRVARWALVLSEFDYLIEHRAGTRMRHVDSLSRSPVLLIKPEILKRISRNQKDDVQLKAIRKLVEDSEYEDYFLRGDILYKEEEGKDLIVIPQGMQTELIKETHENNGHFGMKKVKDIIEKDYWIPKLTKKIEKCIRNCITCILSTRKEGKQEGFLYPIPKEYPLQTYHIDHLGPLPSTHKNYNYLFVVIDAFTKFSWIYPVKTTSTKEVLSKLALQQSTFGNPEVIISNRGTAFSSQDLLHSYGRYAHEL